MIDGITVLHTVYEQFRYGAGWIALPILFGSVILAVLFWMFCKSTKQEREEDRYGFLIGGLIGVLLIVLVAPIVSICRTIPEDKRPVEYYEVMIDDSVSFKEFNEMFNVIEQHGDIYKIKYKEDRYELSTGELLTEEELEEEFADG